MEIAAAKPKGTGAIKNKGRNIKYHTATSKLICGKVGTSSISKFRQEIIPILERDIVNFRQENLKGHLTKQKNITSNEIISNIKENEVKLDATDILKSNSNFSFPLSQHNC